MFAKVKKTLNRLSLREMAKITGVGHATLHRIERGDDFTISTAKKILPVLEVCPCCGRSLPTTGAATND